MYNEHRRSSKTHKYALCIEINNYLHLTLDVYDERLGFSYHKFITVATNNIRNLLSKFEGKAEIFNLKRRYEGFAEAVLHVAVEGTFIIEARKVLNLMPSARYRVVNSQKGNYSPHITYKRSMPRKDVYKGNKVYLKQVRGRVVHTFGTC